MSPKLRSLRHPFLYALLGYAAVVAVIEIHPQSDFSFGLALFVSLGEDSASGTRARAHLINLTPFPLWADWDCTPSVRLSRGTEGLPKLCTMEYNPTLLWPLQVRTAETTYAPYGVRPLRAEASALWLSASAGEGL